jgi:hypothetical protein
MSDSEKQWDCLHITTESTKIVQLPSKPASTSRTCTTEKIRLTLGNGTGDTNTNVRWHVWVISKKTEYAILRDDLVIISSSSAAAAVPLLLLL